MIRQATIEDVETVMDWGRKFHAYSPWGKRVPIAEDDWRQTVENLLASEDGAVFIGEHGFCGGLMVPLYFNYGFRIAQELFWYANKDGTALRKAFEAWAADQGASAIGMSCIADDREKAVRRLFRGAGYAATETALMKELT
jgi:hypothetical protein